MDVLADLLTRARARGALVAHSILHGRWGLAFADDTPLSVHAVLAGELRVECDGHAPVRLLQGDVLLVASGAPYRFVSEPGVRAVPIADAVATPGAMRGERRFTLGRGDGPETVLLCGAYTLEGGFCDTLLAGLPAFMPLRGAARDPAIRSALGLLGEEVARTVPGQQTALDRLLDLLLVYALRMWFARAGSDAPAWYRALDDPHVGRALRALHADPAHAWSVAELAAGAGLSRAAFARRFAALTGRPPLAYLADWRMTLAREALLRPGATVGTVAAEVGYANEFAFAAAFKRLVGAPPGRWRRERLAAAG